MRGILVLAHGSREEKTQATFNAVVDMARKKVDMPVETAYMEFSDKNLEAGLKALIAQGVTEIKVVPYFLFEGWHIRHDVPQEIAAFQRKYRGITITLGKTLGEDPRLADVLADRMLG